MDFLAIPVLFIAPVIAAIMLFYFKSRLSRRVFSKLIRSFIWGMISVVLVVVFQLIMQYLGYDELRNLKRITFYAFIIIGGGEELSKFLILQYFVITKNDSQKPVNGIMFSIMIALGFATVSSILLTFDVLGTAHIYPSRFYPITYTLTHIIFAVMMGFFVSISKKGKSKIVYSLIGLSMASFFHGFYVFCILTRDFKLLNSCR